MGLTHVAVKLRNRDSRDSNDEFNASFLVDTGATDSMVPACELKRIGINPTSKKTYELANGELQEYDIGYAELSFMGETMTSRVIFGPDNCEPILGVVALESHGLVVDPSTRTLKRLRALPLKQIALAK